MASTTCLVMSPCTMESRSIIAVLRAKGVSKWRAKATLHQSPQTPQEPLQAKYEREQEKAPQYPGRRQGGKLITGGAGWRVAPPIGPELGLLLPLGQRHGHELAQECFQLLGLM